MIVKKFRSECNICYTVKVKIKEERKRMEERLNVWYDI